MNPELQVLITKRPEPHPSDPTKGVLAIRVHPRWVVGGAEQECTDQLQVIALLKEALDAAIDNVQFKPPAIVRPALVLPSTH